ncbi:MAG: phosphodiester glycosidase family protein, partial [Pseudomonadota bacterium]
GPMLVIGGKLHPRFLPDSTSFRTRNGVGVHPDSQTAIFAISRFPVTFHHFARLFRDHFKTPNALYLDGSISRMYAPQIDRRDSGGRFGPILGVVQTP